VKVSVSSPHCHSNLTLPGIVILIEQGALRLAGLQFGRRAGQVRSDQKLEREERIEDDAGIDMILCQETMAPPDCVRYSLLQDTS